MTIQRTLEAMLRGFLQLLRSAHLMFQPDRKFFAEDFRIEDAW
jgi:hypothetical protein